MSVKKLWLNSLENSRRTLARMIRAYHRDKNPDSQRFRAEVYAMKALAQFFELERDQEILERVEAIEAMLEDPMKVRQFREIK